LNSAKIIRISLNNIIPKKRKNMLDAFFVKIAVNMNIEPKIKRFGITEISIGVKYQINLSLTSKQLSNNDVNLMKYAVINPIMNMHNNTIDIPIKLPMI